MSELLRALGPHNVSVTYSKTVEWRDMSGGRTAWTTEGTDLRDVEVSAFRLAAQSGWKPKKWWQWWRWDDTPNPSAEVASLLENPDV